MLQKVKPILIWYLEPPPPSTKDKILRSCHRCSTWRKSSKHRQHGSYCAANYLSTAQKMRPNIGALCDRRHNSVVKKSNMATLVNGKVVALVKVPSFY